MEWDTKTLFEAFNYLLEKLGLQQDIWGYTVSLFILTTLLLLKLFILTCLAKYFKTCKRSNLELEEFEL